MNKGIIAGAAAFVVLSFAVGGAIFASTMENSNTNSPHTNGKTKVEEVKHENKKGWAQENGSWYSYKDNEKQTEWFKDNDSWYYLGNDGKMRTGWIKSKDQWYYLNTDGTLATNTTIDGYYLNNNGLIEETPTKAKQSTKSAETNDNITYKTYTNERFGFSIDYPSNFIPEKPPGNHGGLEFKSADGSATFGAFGMHNALDKTIKDFYNEQIEHMPVKPSYSHLNNNSFALSWEKNGIVKYLYFILGKSSYNEFYITYPESEKYYYNNLTDKIYNSFKTPGIDDM